MKHSNCTGLKSCSKTSRSEGQLTESTCSLLALSRRFSKSSNVMKRTRQNNLISSSRLLLFQLNLTNQIISWTSSVSSTSPSLPQKHRKCKSICSSASKRLGSDSMRFSTMTNLDHLTASTGSWWVRSLSWMQSSSIGCIREDQRMCRKSYQETHT